MIDPKHLVDGIPFWEVDGYDPTEHGTRCGSRKSGGTTREHKTHPSPWCRQNAGWGTAHNGIGQCMFHGGGTPNAVAHADKIKAIEAVETFGLPRDIDPQQALLEEVQRSAGHVAYLAWVVANIGVGGLKQHEESKGVLWEKASVWVTMYQTERKLLVVAAKAAVDAGVSERMVSVAEDQAELFAALIRGVLVECGVDVLAPETERIVRRQFDLIIGGAA